MLTTAALLSLLPALNAAQETIVGVYMFHRHGDRTAKSTPPANLTDLGYAQVYESGTYYRSRYIANNATLRINGVNSDLVKQSQIAVSAPADTVLQNSATGFLQGLYPPVGTTISAQELRNRPAVQAPMNGYQLIPVSLVSSGSGSEDNGWLQDATGCANAVQSSNDYFYSPEYMSLHSSTMDFYQSLLPVVNGTFNATTTSYKNAYTIYDLINVAEIHNQTINSSELITSDVFHQLLTLANTHEYNLAYNSSSEIRGIAGMQLAGEAVKFLNSTITSKGKNKIGIQFGAYGTFLSFFGLAGLPAANPDFYGVTDYASSMTFELFTNSTFDTFPNAEDLSVRFLFHNGSANATSPPVQYPLFGGDAMSLSWADFTSSMSRFAVSTTEEWCHACGNTTGTCAPFANSVAGTGSDSSSGSGSNLSNVDAGVIGAFVTVGVLLILGALVFFVGGVTLVSRKRLVQGKSVANGNGATKA